MAPSIFLGPIRTKKAAAHRRLTGTASQVAAMKNPRQRYETRAPSSPDLRRERGVGSPNPPGNRERERSGPRGSTGVMRWPGRTDTQLMMRSPTVVGRWVTDGLSGARHGP